jgi:ATP phosphoribosyltransferase regulatory subunit
MEANLTRMTAPPEAQARRLDLDVRDAAERGRDGLVALLAERRAIHGHPEGAGRAPAEIADRFFEQRALPDPAIAARAGSVLADYLALGAELAGAPRALEEFASVRGLDLGEALALFAKRAAAIEALAPAAAIRFEAGFGRPLDYYTGLVFEVRAEGDTAPLIGGGRYDRLMEMLGAEQPIPAVGFTMRLDLYPGDER